MRKIVFRGDASTELGTGDLVSLINLSKYFEKAGWEPHFILKDHECAREIVKKRAIKRFATIKKDASLQKEIADINGYIADNNIDVIFFEITERKLTEYSGITDNVFQACVNFDGIIHDKISLVVNWDVDADKMYDIVKYPNTAFLLGMEYVALPIEFDAHKISGRTCAPTPRKLLVTMGGSDEPNLTQKIADVLVKNRIDLVVNIVIGSGYRFREGLEDCLRSSLLDYKIEQNVLEMLSRYMNCDIAISAGGLTAFELIATRTPSILIATCEHQIKRCEYFDRAGWARYLGFRRFDEKVIKESLFGPVKAPAKLSFNIERIVFGIDEMLKRR